MADCYGDIDFCLGFLVVHFFSQEIIFLSSVIPIRLGQAYIFVPVSYTVPRVGEKIVRITKLYGRLTLTELVLKPSFISVTACDSYCYPLCTNTSIW